MFRFVEMYVKFSLAYEFCNFKIICVCARASPHM